MPSFFIIVAALCVATAVVLCLPVLRAQTARADPDADDATTDDARLQRDAELAVHDARIAEIDAALAGGTLDTGAAASARAAAQRELLGTLDALERTGSRGHAGRLPTRSLLVPAVAAVLSFAAAGGLYARYGTLDGLNPPPPAVAEASPQADPELLAQTDALAVKLASDPDNGQGWLLLARSRMALDDPGAAVPAFERASALLDPDAAMLADHAESLAMRAKAVAGSGALPLVARALALDPVHPKALWLDGLGALQSGDRGRARERFAALLPRMAPGSAQAQALERLLAELDGGTEPGTFAPPAAGAGGPSTSVPAAAAGPTLRVTVSLDPVLAEAVPPGATLFVFASDADTPAGQPAPPLAAVRIATPRLPVEVVLDNASAMMPGRTLATAERVVISARLTASGTPSLAPGDLQGSAPTLDFSATKAQADGDEYNINIVVDRRNE